MLSAMLSSMTTVFTYLFILVAVAWCWFQWSHRELLRVARSLPLSLQTLPFLGHVHYTIMGLDNTTRYALKMSTEAVAQGINTICFWCGPLPVIMVHGLEDIQKILNSSVTSEKADEYDYFKYASGNGLLTAPNGVWKVTRRHINPLFNFRNLEQLMPDFNRNSRELVTVLSEHVGHGPVNVMDHTMDIGLKTICLTKMEIFVPSLKPEEHFLTRKNIEPLRGIKNPGGLGDSCWRDSNSMLISSSSMSHSEDDGGTVADKTIVRYTDVIFGPDVEIDMQSAGFRGLLKMVEKIPELFIRRVIHVWLRIDSIFEFLYKKELDEMKIIWNNFSETPLKLTKANNELKRSKNTSQNENGIDVDNDIPAEGTLNLLDVYSVLQKNFPEFNDEELKAEMITLFCTGTDTVGAAVASCLLILAQYKDIQERLYHEISSVVGSDDDVESHDLYKMTYLDQVYKETLRWTSIVPYILRKPSEDLKLSDCTIPAGNSIIVCLRGIHMNPKLYPDPHKFDPERFSSENMVGKERYAFIPFSGGPRNCIGKTYAQLLVKTMLVHVLRRYRVSTSMDIHTMKRRLVVTLVSAEGYNITLENRV